ncbi:MFS transporter, partial [bacterium]|nr:MFS transporter [bacterium]
MYSALFITFYFPVFITNYAGGQEQHVGFAMSISTLLAALLVPIVGALSDQSGRRMPYLILCTLGCCAASFAIAFSTLYIALALAVVSLFLYGISLAVYDALLPKLADEETQGAVSGWGVGVGYLGTPFSLVALTLWMSYAGWDTEFSVRGVFVLTAILFLSFSIYPFFVIREPKTPSNQSALQGIARAFRELGQTIRRLPQQRGFLAFLGCAFLFWNAIMSVVVFLYLFSENQLGLSQKQFVMIYAGLAVAAAIGSWIAGKLTDRFGPKKVLALCGVVWILVLVSFLWIDTLTPFTIAGMVGGAAMASYQAAVRPFLIQFAAPEQMGEYFGFLALFNKASGALGPLVFGWATTQYGYNVAICILIGFFVGGLICLAFAPDKRARPLFGKGTI